jgi:ribonuclease HI
MKIIKIYTDGSCNPQQKIGAWAAIILVKDQEILLKDKALNTTHNQMELLAVIKALEYIEKNNFNNLRIEIYSDSQYVVNLAERKSKLKNSNYLTKTGKEIQNRSLVEKIIHYIENLNIEFIKVKAHQKKSDEINYNRDVDKISRKIVRDYLRE